MYSVRRFRGIENRLDGRERGSTGNRQVPVRDRV